MSVLLCDWFSTEYFIQLLLLLLSIIQAGLVQLPNCLGFKINISLAMWNLGLLEGMCTAENVVLASRSLFCNVI